MMRGWRVMGFAAAAIAIGSTRVDAVAPHGLKVLGNPGDWVMPDDYPPEALKANQQGISAFRLAIDGKGVVVGCTITGSSGSPVLDATACRLLTLRARFTPLTDRKGRGLASTYSSAVRWSVSQDDDATPAALVPDTGCSRPDKGEIQVSGLPPCAYATGSGPSGTERRGVTVARSDQGLICTVDIDGATRQLQDAACAAIDQTLEKNGTKLPATTIVTWAGGFPLKGG
jgi:TonB family protein